MSIGASVNEVSPTNNVLNIHINVALMEYTMESVSLLFTSTQLLTGQVTAFKMRLCSDLICDHGTLGSTVRFML